MVVHHLRDDHSRPEIWSPLTGQRQPLAVDLPGGLSAGWYPDGRALLLEHSHHGRSELYRLEVDAERLERLPTPEGTIFGAAVRDDGELWFGWQSSARPPEVRSSNGVLLEAPGEKRPPGAPFSSHVVGDVQVFLAEPSGPPPYPTVVQVHGGPAGQDTDAYRPWTQALVDHGFAVAMVNYHGSSGYGRRWRESLIGNPGFGELADIAAARAWLVERGTADPARLVLSGASWGGYLTLLGLGCQPGDWTVGVALVPIADWEVNYADQSPLLQAYNRTLFGGSPEELPELYRERSPIVYVDRVRAPLLIIAAENDSRCPIRQVDRYVARLAELGKEHEIYRYDAGHGSLVTDELLRQAELMLSFLARHLGTAAPT
jgi:dipeptidyl aminopeptidase/acylaminoacyl peptidase